MSQFYRTKQRQQKERGLRCPGACGQRPTQSHHLFVPRGMGGRDFPELQMDWNIVQICVSCHAEIRYETNVRAALMKLWDYGPDFIEAQVELLPFKVDRGLPAFYYDALDVYIQGLRPFEDF